SLAAFVPGPYMATYFASKAYVLSFTEALDEELRGTGVRATALCPGPVATEFQKRAGIGHSPLFSGGVLDAARVARAGYDAMMRGRRVKLPSVGNRMMAFATRWVPRTLVARAVRRLNSTRDQGG
ncbi:MAG: SDR family NAD(P)-dependent oxidoreductase, partial [Tepidisphaeraceae bacterium]